MDGKAGAGHFIASFQRTEAMAEPKPQRSCLRILRELAAPSEPDCVALPESKSLTSRVLGQRRRTDFRSIGCRTLKAGAGIIDEERLGA